MTNSTSNAIDNTIKQDHAKDQAAAQYSSIVEMVQALNCDFDRLDELKDEKESLEYAINEAHDDLAASQKQGLETELHIEAVTNANDAMDEFRNDGRESELNALMSEAVGNQDRDAALDAIQEDPLSVEVRSGWGSVGDGMQAEEFNILLCTGGPAVRIRGEIGQHSQPTRAWMEYQDWGTGWVQFYDAEQSVLLAYCSEFYFGDV
jgi:hypothetical protein